MIFDMVSQEQLKKAVVKINAAINTLETQLIARIQAGIKGVQDQIGDVEDSVSELANKFTWKSRTINFTSTGSNISVSELGTANEILFTVKAGTTQYQYEFTVLPKVMTSGNLIAGYSTTGGTHTGMCEFSYVVSAKVIAIKSLSIGNTSYTSGTITVCYR